MGTINIGKVRQSFEGTYSASTAYTVLDTVFFSGESYVCIQATTAGTAPTNTTHWQKIAAKGADGADGADGSDGATGATGPQGTTGAAGPTGAQGPAGNDGATGAQGAAGAAGPTGPQGLTGPTGAQGADGNDGATGATGPQGAAGPQGAVGPQGAAGSTDTAAQLLVKIKTVDGSGSGLDADSLDGIQASSFLRSDANDTKTGTFNLRTNLDMQSDNNTAARYVNLPRGGGITFYGNGSVSHGITSRNSGGTVTDDLLMQSYGGIFLGLDNNNNNSSGADFKIVTNGNSTARLTFSGENYGLTVSGNVTAYSDRRLKDDIQPIEGALEKLDTLSGNTYLRNDLPETDTERRYAGVIAQEVEAVLPEAVSDSEDGTKTVDYNAVIALLVESIKELKAEVAQLKGGA